VPEGKGLIPAVEVLINNPRVKDMITEPTKTHQILRAIEESDAREGMQSFDQSLLELVRKKKISFQTAMAMSTSPEDFRLKHSGVTPGHDRRQWEQQTTSEDTNFTQWNQLEGLDLETAYHRPKKVAKPPEAPTEKPRYQDEEDKTDPQIPAKAPKLDVVPRVIKKKAK
jgi:hypothetical protein